MSNNIKGFNPEYDDNKDTNVIHFGKRNKKNDESSYRKVELFIDEEVSYLSEKNRDADSVPVRAKIKDDVVLYQSSGGQQKIHCWLVEAPSGKSVEAVKISRRTGKGVYGSQEITLTLRGLDALREFVTKLTVVDSDSYTKIPINSGQIKNESSTKLLSAQEFNELIKANVKSTDDFYKLISIQKMVVAVNRLEDIISGNYENELDIQRFLRENIWMFGNDYVYVVEENKINAQNILDMIPQNFESYVDIIEVKLPNEKLFNFDSSHSNHYSTSHLTKAIAQTQNYIFELEKKSYDDRCQRENGYKIIRPKGIILFGSQEPLNEAEKQYLRVLNSSFHNLQIITYQQLLEKAKNSLKIGKDKTASGANK
jgi:hypothetical protein